MKKRKIYVASSWRNAYQQKVVGLLEGLGHEVYDFRNPSKGDHGFSWGEIDPNWQKWTTEEYARFLGHPIAERGFKNDFDAMEWADTCVLVLPSGRSAHTEAGWMAGQGKDVWVYSPEKEEPELMYKVFGENAIVPEYYVLKALFTIENAAAYAVVDADSGTTPSALKGTSPKGGQRFGQTG